MSNKKKILFIIGSPNQTTQMHQIQQHLADDYDCYFSQFHGNNWVIRGIKGSGLLEHTIMSGHFKDEADEYLAKHGLQNDFRATMHEKYDLAVICNDLVVPKKVRNTKSIWVQEGMIDPVTNWSKFVKAFGIPRYFAMGTSLNGSSNICDIYCVASEGYRDFLSKMGTRKEKLVVTGIPNFDNAAQYLDNDFPHKDYVLVCTTDMRETFRKEDRPAFLKKCVEIAEGRPMIFKLHPNEMRERAEQEIRAVAPEETMIFQEGDTNAMIANCEELITQYSTVVYVGIALGKKVHSNFDVYELKQQTPIQNGGRSAEVIAQLCRDYIEYPGTRKDFLKQYKETYEKQAAVSKQTVEA